MKEFSKIVIENWNDSKATTIESKVNDIIVSLNDMKSQLEIKANDINKICSEEIIDDFKPEEYDV